MPIYMKLSDSTSVPGSLDGPEDPTAGIALPPGQPAGWPVAQSWGVEAFQFGVSRANLFSKAGTGAGAGVTTPSEFSVALLPNTTLPSGPAVELYRVATVGTNIDSVATETRPAAGGLSQAWVLFYWLLQNCVVTNFVASCSDGEPETETISLAVGAAGVARFAPPAGGVPGGAHVLRLGLRQASSLGRVGRSRGVSRGIAARCRATGQAPSERGEECPVRPRQPRPWRRAAQQRQLVAENHDLRLARETTATASAEQPQHGYEGEVEEAQSHPRHPADLRRSVLQSRIRVLEPLTRLGAPAS